MIGFWVFFRSEFMSAVEAGNIHHEERRPVIEQGRPRAGGRLLRLDGVPRDDRLLGFLQIGVHVSRRGWQYSSRGTAPSYRAGTPTGWRSAPSTGRRSS